MTPQFRVLLVGAGNMGRAWAKNLTACDEVALAGWVDIMPDAAARAAHELGIAIDYTSTDLEKALAEVKPDFLVDVSIPEAHHDVTLTALAAGVPVLGEKPMADTMERAREMVAASERAGKLYMVSQSRRYNAQLQAFRRLIAEQIGELGILNADFYLGPHFGGFREQMAHVLILDMAIHTFDAARYLSNADPVSVYCEEFNPPWSWYNGASSAVAIFEMSNGIRYTYRGSWCAEGRMTSWEGEWRAVGANGTATWDGTNPPRAEVVTQHGAFFSGVEQRTTPVEDIAPAIAGSLRDFLHALKTGATPMGECHDNIKSLAMVFAAIESAQTGQRVSIKV
jgi:predicted dehydrogenase